MKAKGDHRSKFPNLSNWKEEAWKYQGLNGIRTRDLRDTGTMLDQLSFLTFIYNRSTNINLIILIITLIIIIIMITIRITWVTKYVVILTRNFSVNW